MKEIRLLSLRISNFKGCGGLTLDLDGRSASIYGDNASGKTTVYDALTWLLFGKDSSGSGDFKIKPLGEDGQVRDHAAVTEVEAVFSSDGAPIKLKKTFFEKWSTKRGSADASYDGNTSEYFVDEVPTKKYEFERRVGELVDEGLFRMLTNVTWFCEGMDWKARRKALFDVCGVPDDREIMAENPQFSSLAEALGTLSMDDYKKKLQAKRSGLNGARNTIPARLDEQKQLIAALASIDFPAIQAQRGEVADKLDKLSGELLKLEHGALADSRRNELAALENELVKLVTSNNWHRQSQLIPVEDKRPALRADLDKAKKELLRWAALAKNEKSLMEIIEQKIQSCRELWAAEDARAYQPGNCPTCGQTLPQAAQEAARASFEAEKERRKQEAIDRAAREKENLADAHARSERYISDAVLAENEAARLEAELAAYVPGEQPEVTDLPGYAQEHAALSEKIRAAQADVLKLSGESAVIRAEIGEKVAALKAELSKLDGELAKKALLEFTVQREEALRQEAKKAAQALEELDSSLFLCEEFTRFKVRYIEDSINGKFRLARFKLFDQQVNGGLADCCEATYGGVPYSDLNNGMRVNLGVDVIRTVSEHYGLRVPLVVDNAESVVELMDAGTQVIRLIVSGADKKLRCEYGA